MNTQELQKLANKLRLEAVRMVYEGKDGHPGPALSIADIVATLYFDAMNVDPKNPEWEDRDRFILSKGHACPIWYAALNEKGYFEPKVEHFHLSCTWFYIPGTSVNAQHQRNRYDIWFSWKWNCNRSRNGSSSQDPEKRLFHLCYLW